MTASDSETLPSSPAANECSGGQGCCCFSFTFPLFFLSLLICLINLFGLGFSLLSAPTPLHPFAAFPLAPAALCAASRALTLRRFHWRWAGSGELSLCWNCGGQGTQEPPGDAGEPSQPSRRRSRGEVRWGGVRLSHRASPGSRAEFAGGRGPRFLCCQRLSSHHPRRCLPLQARMEMGGLGSGSGAAEEGLGCWAQRGAERGSGRRRGSPQIWPLALP